MDKLYLEDVNDIFGDLDSGKINYNYGSDISKMIGNSGVYGRSYDQTHYCRLYFEDLKSFALGGYVQKSDMKKINKDESFYQVMDSLEIGVNSTNDSFFQEEYFINQDIFEFNGYPRVLITNPRNFVFEENELFFKILRFPRRGAYLWNGFF